MWAGCRVRSVQARVQRVTRGCGARAEHTLNMPAMVVTLAVLKLSGWLKATACCPVERRVFKAGDVWAGRCERVGWLRCKERAVEGLKGDQGVRGTGGAHVEHDFHGGDIGRVEAQRLVERRRVLPSRKEGIQGRRRVGWQARACGPVAMRGMGGRGGRGATRGCKARAERT